MDRWMDRQTDDRQMTDDKQQTDRKTKPLKKFWFHKILLRTNFQKQFLVLKFRIQTKYFLFPFVKTGTGKLRSLIGTSEIWV